NGNDGGFPSGERKKEREGRKIPSVIKSYEIVNRVARPPPGAWGTNQATCMPSTGGSGIRKELKPESIGEAVFLGDSVESVRTLDTVEAVDMWNVGRVYGLPGQPLRNCISSSSGRLKASLTYGWNPLDQPYTRPMGEPKLSVPVGLAPRSSTVDQSASTAAGRLNLIPVQVGRQQPLPRPGEGGGLTPRPRHGEANRSTTTSLHQAAVGNIESNKLIDEVIPAAALSDLKIRTRTGGQPTEMPPRSPTQISGQKEV
ncbi:hypothetical protein THAOC_13579, partial [Thalassiosira oceanica]